MVPSATEQPPSREIGVGSSSSENGTVSMLSRQKEPLSPDDWSSTGSDGAGDAEVSAKAALDPAISRIAAQQFTRQLDIGFIATAHVCRPCASAPGRIRKTLYAKEYDRIFAMQHKFPGSKARQNCAREPDGKFPIC